MLARCGYVIDDDIAFRAAADDILPMSDMKYLGLRIRTANGYFPHNQNGERQVLVAGGIILSQRYFMNTPK